MSYVCSELAQANEHDLQNNVNRLNDHAQGQDLPDPNAPYLAPPEDQRGEHGANVVILRNHQERLYFLYVDTCLAIIFLLNNGMAIGGHAIFEGLLDGVPAGEPEAVIQDMRGLIPHGANIVAIHLVGDFENFHPNIDDIIQDNVPNAPQPVFHQVNVAVDVVVSHDLGDWHIDVLPFVQV